MGEAADQIMSQIEVERGRLGADLNELEGKVKRGISIDWRRQFDEKPLLMLGLAVGGGILLASLMNKGSRDDDDYDDDDYVTSSAAGSAALVPSNATLYQKKKAAETFDNIKGALIGVAVSSVRKFLDDAVPGFTDQFRQTEEKASSLRGSYSDPDVPSSSPSYSGAGTGYAGSTGLDEPSGSMGSSYGSGTVGTTGSYGSTGSSYGTGSSGSSYDPATPASRSYTSSDPNVPSSS